MVINGGKIKMNVVIRSLRWFPLISLEFNLILKISKHLNIETKISLYSNTKSNRNINI